MATAGYGAGDHNALACTSDYTYVDTDYPADETFSVTSIYVYNTDAGTSWEVGCGSLSGDTFTPRTYVVIAATATGAQTFTAPTDFTAFEMQSGDLIFFYSHVNKCEPDTTNSATPEGLRYSDGGGKHMDDETFETTLDSARTIEIQFTGSAGWAGGTMNGTSMAKLNGVAVANIASINSV